VYPVGTTHFYFNDGLASDELRGANVVTVDRRSRAPLSGLVFLVLAVAGNALQGSTPALHGDADAVADFYNDKATAIAFGMMLSLISVFFLAWFVAALHRHLRLSEGADGWISPLAAGGGVATLSLLAAGFALNAAGALRARESGIAPDVAAVFYDSSLALIGLAASVAMAILLAATAVITFQFSALPRWFGWVSAMLAGLGIVTPVSFVLSLVFPLWVGVAAVLLMRRSPTAVGQIEVIPTATP
jgi:hypothetical protein